MGEARYPLEILPKEMWQRIILEVDDSEDIRNLMKASKQLNDTFISIHHLWLLDKVLPFLIPTTKVRRRYHLEVNHLKKLRLVNKRWYGAVNTFLENRPHLRPYNKNDEKVNSEEHIWTERCRGYNVWDRSSGPWAKGGFSYNLNRIDQFRINFEDPDRNPFPSRSINESILPLAAWEPALSRDREYNYDIDKLLFVEEMKREVFQKFGKHIWFLKMAWREIDRFGFSSEDNYNLELQLYNQYGTRWRPAFIWEWIVKSLSSLPNLKNFHLEIPDFDLRHIKDAEARQLLREEKNQLPSMQFLESLQISQFNLHPVPDLFAQQLVSAFSLQLRRLHISMFNWETCGKWSFPNLTELFLKDITDGLETTVILAYLEAPQLAKLKLTSSEKDIIKLRMEKDIFCWIRLFPSLLSLDISDKLFSITERGTLRPQRDSMLSLKYLKIYNTHGVNYNFLRCLPNLERLKIRVDSLPIVWDCSVYHKVRIKLEIETRSLYQSNVWELCPKLKALSCVDNSFWFDEFDRSTYEKVKDRRPRDKNLAWFRINFLQSNKEIPWHKVKEECPLTFGNECATVLQCGYNSWRV